MTSQVPEHRPRALERGRSSWGSRLSPRLAYLENASHMAANSTCLHITFWVNTWPRVSPPSFPNL